MFEKGKPSRSLRNGPLRRFHSEKGLKDKRPLHLFYCVLQGSVGKQGDKGDKGEAGERGRDGPQVS